MQVRAIRQDGLWVLRLVGPLVLGEGEHRLRCVIERLLRQGARHVVLDLSGVRYMDAAGLGALAASARRIQRRGGRLVVASPSSRVRRSLEIVRLNTLLPVADSLEAARERFDPVARRRPALFLPPLRPLAALR